MAARKKAKRTPARKATAKKTPAKKAPAKKAPAKKAPAKKATAKKATAKRATASRATARKVTAPTAKRAAPARDNVLAGLPILWQHQGSGQAIGLHIDDNEVWAGWENGDVVACDHKGEILRRWKLPAGVDSLVADEVWRYAGCRDGNIYDLTGRAPRVAYEVDPNAHIQWVDVYRGNLCASDSKGACTAVDAEQKQLWKFTQKGGSSGWMVRTDGTGVYLGNSHGATKFDWSGNQLWHTKSAWIGYGWPEGDNIYTIAGAWTRDVEVIVFRKDDGKIVMRGSCWSTEKHYQPAHSAAAAAASTGGDRVFGGTCDTLFCFDASGALLWESPTRVGATCSMAFHEEKLFVVTGTGVFACLAVSPAAVAQARSKASAAPKARKLASIEVTERAVEDVTEAGAGVIVECVKEGGKVRVRVVSDGYHADWFCQFPRDLREVGARFVVDQVREASQGGFYRVLGDIRRLRT